MQRQRAAGCYYSIRAEQREDRLAQAASSSACPSNARTATQKSGVLRDNDKQDAELLLPQKREDRGECEQGVLWLALAAFVIIALRRRLAFRGLVLASCY